MARHDTTSDHEYLYLDPAKASEPTIDVTGGGFALTDETIQTAVTALKSLQSRQDGHDLLEISARRQESDEDKAKREFVEAELNIFIAAIDDRIAEISARDHEEDTSEQVEHLKELRQWLEGEKTNARYAPISIVNSIATSLNMTSGKAKEETSHAQSAAKTQMAITFAEMTDSAVEVIMIRNDYEAKQFQQYEQNSHDYITGRAESLGIQPERMQVYNDIRDSLTKERDAARANGNRVGAFEADALLATNNYYGLLAVDAPKDKLEEALHQRQEARERYLEEVAIKARDEAKRLGLSGKAAEEYIQGELQAGEAHLDKREAQIEAEHGAAALGLTGKEAEEYIQARTNDRQLTQEWLELREKGGSDEEIEAARRRAEEERLTHLRYTAVKELGFDADLADTFAKDRSAWAEAQEELRQLQHLEGTTPEKIEAARKREEQTRKQSEETTRTTAIENARRQGKSPAEQQAAADKAVEASQNASAGTHSVMDEAQRAQNVAEQASDMGDNLAHQNSAAEAPNKAYQRNDQSEASLDASPGEEAPTQVAMAEDGHDSIVQPTVPDTKRAAPALNVPGKP